MNINKFLLLSIIYLFLIGYSCHILGQKTIYDKKLNYTDSSITNYDYISKLVFLIVPDEESIDFSHSRFKIDADFRVAHFQKWSDFSNVKFEKDASFQFSKFKEGVTFSDATFQSKAEFSYSYFLKNSHFLKDTFRKRAEFMAASFKGSVDFSQSIFFKKADFSFVKFDSTTSFSWATFLDTIDFIGTEINCKRIDFTQCHTDTIEGIHEPTLRFINLLRTDVSKIKLDYLHFRLFFLLNTTYEEKANVYNGLLKNFRDDGFTDSYEIMDKEFKLLTYNHKIENSNILGKIYFSCLKNIDRYWWDYGYSKGMVFKWIIIFILIFTLITYFVYPRLREVYLINNIPCEGQLEILYKNHSFLKKSYSAFLYTIILFFSLNVKLEKVKWWQPKRYVGYIFLVYLIGLVCLGYAISFVLQK
jgi:hypothetical protein